MATWLGVARTLAARRGPRSQRTSQLLTPWIKYMAPCESSMGHQSNDPQTHLTNRPSEDPRDQSIRGPDPRMYPREQCEDKDPREQFKRGRLDSTFALADNTHIHYMYVHM